MKLQFLQIPEKGIHILLPGGPAGAEAHGSVGIIDLLPDGIGILFRQLCQILIREDRKLLVCGGLEEERISLFPETVPDPVCHLIRMAGDVIIETVLKEHFKLATQQPALGQSAAPLF